MRAASLAIACDSTSPLPAGSRAEQLHGTPAGMLLAAASGALASGVGYFLWYVALRELSAVYPDALAISEQARLDGRIAQNQADLEAAGHWGVPTMVFDEVDAGVGGKAAVEIGRRLGALSKSTQVLVVTHLPQVAAFADSHFVVRKSSDGSVTTSGLERLDKQSRVKELSRMLAGLEESDTALAHAEELLDIAQMTRNKG